LPAASQTAGLDHGALAPLFGTCPLRTRLSRDSLAGDWLRLAARLTDSSEDELAGHASTAESILTAPMVKVSTEVDGNETALS